MTKIPTWGLVGLFGDGVSEELLGDLVIAAGLLVMGGAGSFWVIW
ncbi:MAG: hypothetical protein AAF990_18320 [Bacteroidota bacterium]